MSETAPEWAAREFCKRANLNYERVLVMDGDEGVTLRSAVRAGGLLVAAHEEAPVDPLLIEARMLACDFNRPAAKDVLKGNYDGGDYVRLAMNALRRGIELAKSGAS